MAFGETTIYPSRGVRQGGSASPELFTFYLDKVLRSIPFLKKKLDEKALLAFADDLLIECVDEAETVEAIQAIKALKCFGLEPEDPPPPKAIGGVEVVQSHKYLGIKVQSRKADILKDTKAFCQRIDRHVRR